MEKGRPKSGITLTAREREQLEHLANKPGQPAHIATRARIILRSVEGDSNVSIANSMALTQATVGKWRRRFASHRILGLYDSMRTGKPRTIDDRQLQAITTTAKAALASEDTASDSVRALAARTGMSKSSVARYLQLLGKTKSRPHFALFSDPLLLEQLQAPAAIYLSGSDKALVICLDTKSPLSLPAAPATPRKVSTLLGSEGCQHPLSAALCKALNSVCKSPATQCKPRLRHQEFLVFLREVEAMFPPHVDVHCILDTSALSQHPSIKAWLGMRPHWCTHGCGDYASWHEELGRFLGRLGAQRSATMRAEELTQWLQSVDALARQQSPNRRPFRWMGPLHPLEEDESADREGIQASGEKQHLQDR
ncbi:helix-turn-helix domain-containing protein [Comamonas sp. B-9]|uniref:helix-turn-helix domain-containing protein n=1 Tax=Comamonas sp. B-9 TaxID=1055192 RepID=UPI000395CA94|nr:helix-turn-helix domain-containing protein [Comamonas sp. B-9]